MYLNVRQILEQAIALAEDHDEEFQENDERTKQLIQMLNAYIGVWADDDVEWAELWRNDVLAVIKPGIRSYKLPERFRRLGGFINIAPDDAILSNDGVITDGLEPIIVNENKTTYERIPVIKPVQDQLTGSSSARICFVTGNPRTGFVLNLGWSPEATEFPRVIKAPYFQYHILMEKLDDVPEMSKPSFLVHSLAARIAQLEDSSDSQSQLASRALESMRNDNELLPEYQDDTLQDVGYLVGDSPLGR